MRNDVRASDAERDSAAAQLREHFVQGRLTLDELKGRLDTALTAKTRRQLDTVLADLPPHAQRSRVPQPVQPAFPGRYAALAVLIIVMAVWLLAAAWFSQHGYGGYGPR
ncbi:MAG TPA: DUF1707 domain-containing protein [Streptosporangiaceae bacterium]|jgi:hypothetical protein|nr:DUF1707 domain-containing protein [Streptosporangiaceae bacterium]